jgi:hypothetical protein
MGSGTRSEVHESHAFRSGRKGTRSEAEAKERMETAKLKLQAAKAKMTEELIAAMSLCNNENAPSADNVSTAQDAIKTMQEYMRSLIEYESTSQQCAFATAREEAKDTIQYGELRNGEGGGAEPMAPELTGAGVLERALRLVRLTQVCVCVCVCVHNAHTHTHTCIYICMYILILDPKPKNHKSPPPPTHPPPHAHTFISYIRRGKRPVMLTSPLAPFMT